MQVRLGETIAQEGRAKPSRPDITCAPSAGMALPDPNLEKVRSDALKLRTRKPLSPG
jgi:hypothetical protein